MRATIELKYSVKALALFILLGYGAMSSANVNVRGPASVSYWCRVFDQLSNKPTLNHQLLDAFYSELKENKRLSDGLNHRNEKLAVTLKKYAVKMQPEDFMFVALELISTKTLFVSGEYIPDIYSSAVVNVFESVREASRLVPLSEDQIMVLKKAMRSRPENFREKLKTVGFATWGDDDLRKLYAIVDSKPFGKMGHLGAPARSRDPKLRVTENFLNEWDKEKDVGISFELKNEILDGVFERYQDSMTPADFVEVSLKLIKSKTVYTAGPSISAKDVVSAFEIIRQHSLTIDLSTDQILSLMQAMLKRPNTFKEKAPTIFFGSWSEDALNDLDEILYVEPFGQSHHVGMIH